MRQFNYIEAMQGKPLITRDGRKVLDFHIFLGLNNFTYPIKVVIEGENAIRGYTLDGREYATVLSNQKNDLFMYEEPNRKTYYANVFTDKENGIRVGGCHETSNKAKEFGGMAMDYIKTIEITI